MKLDARALGIAFAVATAVLWVICSLFVAILPGAMMAMSGHMVHANFGGMSWTMSIIGFLIGLVIWTGIAFVTGWLIGVLYNRMERT